MHTDLTDPMRQANPLIVLFFALVAILQEDKSLHVLAMLSKNKNHFGVQYHTA